MTKKLPLIIMIIVLIFCMGGYFFIRNIEWEESGNPNATTIENSQTISEATEALEETTEEEMVEEN